MKGRAEKSEDQVRPKPNRQMTSIEKEAKQKPQQKGKTKKKQPETKKKNTHNYS